MYFLVYDIRRGGMLYCSDIRINIGESYGGRGRARTGDPLLAKQVLSQLSYTPIEIASLEDFSSFILRTLSPYCN